MHRLILKFKPSFLLKFHQCDVTLFENREEFENIEKERSVHTQTISAFERKLKDRQNESWIINITITSDIFGANQ